MDKLTATTVRC